MPEILHFPRLSTRATRVVLRQLEATPALFAAAWQDRSALPGAIASFATTGGRRLADAELSALRDRIVALAVAAGFGSAGAGDFRLFDFTVAVALFEENLVPAPEALRDDVWAWLTTILAPDIVQWRFGDTAERYAGGLRNTFQRLWLRAMAFRRETEEGRWELVERLNEDANLQILERPSIAATRPVTRALGEGWVEATATPPAKPIERTLRDVAISIRIMNQVLCLEDLPEDDLRSEVRGHFHRAAGKS